MKSNGQIRKKGEKKNPRKLRELRKGILVRYNKRKTEKGNKTLKSNSQWSSPCVSVAASSLGAKPSKSKERPKLPSGLQPLLGEDAEQNGPR